MAHMFKVSPNWQIILRDLGLKPGDVLRRAGLPEGLMTRANASITAEEYFRLWRGIEEEMGDRPAALEIGQNVSVEAFDPAIFAALCSPDLNTVREQLARHYLRHSTMTGAEISFMLGYDDPNSFFRAFRAWTGQTPEGLRASFAG